MNIFFYLKTNGAKKTSIDLEIKIIYDIVRQVHV